MSTLSEIEAALDRLAPEELRQLEALLQQRRERAYSSEEIASLERHNGIDPLPDRPGGPVTVEMVRQLCADEGV